VSSIRERLKRLEKQLGAGQSEPQTTPVPCFSKQDPLWSEEAGREGPVFLVSDGEQER